MRMMLPLIAVAAMTSGCVIVVDGDDDDDYDSFRMSLSTGPVDVAQTVELDGFDKIDASAGTRVSVVAGDRPTIGLDDRAMERTEFSMRGDTLKITCKKPCRGSGSRGEVEVTAVRLNGIEVSSGAAVEVEDNIPTDGGLALSVSSGGKLDAEVMSVNAATVSASSGGSVVLTVEDALTASASSGGRVRYYGNPTGMTVSESSGGSIKRH